jgi:hypothetical protein
MLMRSLHKFGLASLFFIFFTNSLLKAQIKNPSLRGFPVAFYTEETCFAFGGLGIYTFDFENSLKRTSCSNKFRGTESVSR